jgi:hypothetical protein
LLVPCQKLLGKKHGLTRRWQDAHLVAFGPYPVLLQVDAALMRTPTACIVPQLAAVFLNDDDPLSRLKNDARVAPLKASLEFGPRVERIPAKIREKQRIAACCNGNDRVERRLLLSESLP